MQVGRNRRPRYWVIKGSDASVNITQQVVMHLRMPDRVRQVPCSQAHCREQRPEDVRKGIDPAPEEIKRPLRGRLQVRRTFEHPAFHSFLGLSWGQIGQAEKVLALEVRAFR